MRLIDADKLDETLADTPIRFPFDKRQMFELIKNAPTIDAVEVVRCRDCKWWNKPGCAIFVVDDSDKPKADDYCIFGERVNTYD